MMTTTAFVLSFAKPRQHWRRENDKHTVQIMYGQIYEA